MSGDPFDRLRRLDPVARERVTADDEARLEAILDGTLGPSPRSHRRRTVVVAAAVVAVTSIATAAWVIVRREQPTDPTGIVCHSEEELDEGMRKVLEFSDDPIEACAQLWLDGTFGAGFVPELTACVNEEGAAVVLPAPRDVCERLGMADMEPPDGSLDPERELVERLSAALNGCVGRDEALSTIERVLDELELTGWRVTDGRPFTEETPCAVAGIDAPGRTVILSTRGDPDLVPHAPGGP